MCGINGILRLDDSSPAIDLDELRRTSRAMHTRGPDGNGEWLSSDGRIALAHRRLAIIDLSPAGAQPMATSDGRFRIVYNGEIYNFRELRAELERGGVRFHSNSDTEVLLQLISRHGPSALTRLRGMFAFALWDEAENELLLARDPFGIKPLYYSAQDGTVRFASQVKALEAGRGARGAVDPAGLVGFLLWGSVPEPLTIRAGIKALPAGSFLVVRNGRVEEPISHRCLGSDTKSNTSLSDPTASIEDSVRAHLTSDVPVAVFLSAGLDSTMIAALACRHLPEPPITFTLRFEELRGTPEDEGPLAAEVAKGLGTRHTERLVTRSEFVAMWPDAIRAMDQPSIDGFNTFIVARAAHEAGLKVVLSGLGGDELFGSYPSFRDVPRLARAAGVISHIPGGARLAARFAAAVRPGSPKLPAAFTLGDSLAGAYFLRRALFLPAEIPALVGDDLAAEGLTRHDPIGYTGQLLDAVGAGERSPACDGWVATHLLETSCYMRNQLLRDTDWASMAHSLEVRVPFVDCRLHEAVVAAGFEPARSEGKGAVVRRVAPELPTALFERRKSGFFIPAATWMAPDGGATPSPRGLASRRLAVRVLQEFGIEAGRAA